MTRCGMVSCWLLGEGVVWAVGGRPRVVWDFTISDGKIVHIDMLAASDSLDRIDLTVLDG